MPLSMAIGSMALVLGVVLAGGYAVGEDAARQAGAPKSEEREAQRRAALEEHQKRKDAFERACNRPLRSESDLELCRAAYQRLSAGS